MRAVRAGIGLLLAAAVAGCATTTGGTGTMAADVTGGTSTGPPVPSGSTADPSGSAPTGSTAATSGPAPAGRRVQVGSVSVPVPAGSRTRTDGAYLCIVLLDAGPGCSVEVIDIRAERSAGGSLSNPEPGARYGWWWGSDVPSCQEGDVSSPVTGETVVRTGFQKVGSKNAAYGSYLVSCQNSDLDFDPQIWWLPTSQVAFRQLSSVAGTSEAVAPILAGVTYG